MPARFPLASILAIFAGCQGNPQLISYGVYGYVESAQSGRAISGADVVFTSDTLRTASDRTDGDGRYEIVALSDTAFGHLTVSHAGYETKVVDVYFDDETRRVDVELGPAPAE